MHGISREELTIESEVRENRDVFCIDCGKLLEQPIPGVIAEAWLRTNGDKSIIKTVPGGIVYGKELGFVCNNCHLRGRNDKED